MKTINNYIKQSTINESIDLINMDMLQQLGATLPEWYYPYLTTIFTLWSAGMITALYKYSDVFDNIARWFKSKKTNSNVKKLYNKVKDNPEFVKCANDKEIDIFNISAVISDLNNNSGEEITDIVYDTWKDYRNDTKNK